MTSLFTNPLHLYRHLLRETTYLFDSNAREYVSKRIVSSFKNPTSAGTSKRPKYNENHLPSLQERHRLKEGRKALSTLQRANNGHLIPLENVLRLTYGRKGRRRRELMTELMLREPAENNPEPQRPNSTSGVTQSAKGWKPPPKFDTLMRSQIMVQNYLSHKSKIRLSPTYAENNTWGKPMPECRIRNLMKKWYTKSARLLFPPLSQTEWENIAAVTDNKRLSITPRRVGAQTRGFTTEHSESMAPEVAVDLTSKVVTGPEKRKSRRLVRLLGNPHKLKPRFLKRLYARTILKHTPTAMAIPDGSGVVYKWELGRKKIMRSKGVVVDTDQFSALFG